MLTAFKKLHTFREDREEGFSLMEIIVVIIIMGILSAIAIPLFLNQRQNAVDDAVVADVKTLVDTANSVRANNPNAGYMVLREGRVCAGASAYPATCPPNSPKPQMINPNGRYAISGGGGASGTDGEYYVSGYAPNGNKYKANENRFFYSSKEKRYYQL